MLRALVLCIVAVAACASGADRRSAQPGDSSSDDAAPAAADGVTECTRLAPTASDVCEVSGSGAGLRIRGTVLTPGMVYVGGDVTLGADGIISCVGCDCPEGGKLITCPRGVISPGLINTHDHLTFAHSAPVPDSGERYEHRHDWRLGQHGHRMLEVPGNASPEQLRWGELRFLLGGATSTLGAGAQPGWLRNLDRAEHSGLPRAASVLQTFPLDDANGLLRANDCDYGAEADTAAEVAGYASYVTHVAEGIGASARNEFRCLSSTAFDVSAPGFSQDLRLAQAAFVHGLGLVAADFAGMAQAGTALVWSPRSNLRLYGDTAQVRLADALGVRIALGTDWLATGSMNLLRELRCAADFNATYLDGYFSDEQLWRMVSADAAAVAKAAEWVGTLREGAQGDIAIFDGAIHPLWRAVIDAEPKDVALVLRAGKPLYGDATTVAALADDCDPLDVCARPKRVCARSEIGTSLAVLQASVGEIYPAFFCGTPGHEPSCVPVRPTRVSGSTTYSGELSGADSDGDGIDDANDNCARVFNPIRPLDRGTQPCRRRWQRGRVRPRRSPCLRAVRRR